MEEAYLETLSPDQRLAVEGAMMNQLSRDDAQDYLQSIPRHERIENEALMLADMSNTDRAAFLAQIEDEGEREAVHDAFFARLSKARQESYAAALPPGTREALLLGAMSAQERHTYLLAMVRAMTNEEWIEQMQALPPKKRAAARVAMLHDMSDGDRRNYLEWLADAERTLSEEPSTANPNPSPHGRTLVEEVLLDTVSKDDWHHYISALTPEQRVRSMGVMCSRMNREAPTLSFSTRIPTPTFTLNVRRGSAT